MPTVMVGRRRSVSKLSCRPFQVTSLLHQSFKGRGLEVKQAQWGKRGGTPWRRKEKEPPPLFYLFCDRLLDLWSREGTASEVCIPGLELEHLAHE